MCPDAEASRRALNAFATARPAQNCRPRWMLSTTATHACQQRNMCRRRWCGDRVWARAYRVARARDARWRTKPREAVYHTRRACVTSRNVPSASAVALSSFDATSRSHQRMSARAILRRRAHEAANSLALIHRERRRANRPQHLTARPLCASKHSTGSGGSHASLQVEAPPSVGGTSPTVGGGLGHATGARHESMDMGV